MTRPLVAGVCSVTLRSLPAADVARLAAAAGLDAVEWAADVHVPPGDVTTADEVRRRSADLGLASASYGSYWFAGQSDPAEVPAVLATALALGAPHVRIWAAWGVGPGSSADDRRRVADATCDFAVAAEQDGLSVSLEFHGGTLTETASSTCRLLHDADAPNLFTYWQPAHGERVPHLLEELDAVIPHLSHLHVFRWRDGDERLPLADGSDLWPAALARAADDGGRWRGPRVAFLEFVRGDDPEQLRADAATLRSWLEP